MTAPPTTTTPAALAAPVPNSPVDDLDGFTHRFVDVDGTRLHVVIGGSGPAVVLLHGWPYTWRVWRPVLVGLAATGRTVIVPDLRGTGDSAKPASGYTKVEVAEDVHQLVRWFGFERADVVGMDIGSMVAFAYATSHPEEVGHLVLSESVLPGFGLEELMDVAHGGLWHFGFHMQVDLAEMLTTGKEEAYLTPGWDGSSTGGVTAADRADFLAHYRAPGGMRGDSSTTPPCSRTGAPTAPASARTPPAPCRCPFWCCAASRDFRRPCCSTASARLPRT